MVLQICTDDSFFYVKGEIPSNIKGARITILLFYNDRKIHETRTRAYERDERGKYRPSNNFSLKLNKDIVRVFIDGVIGEPPHGKYHAIAYAQNTTYKDEGEIVL